MDPKPVPHTARSRLRVFSRRSVAVLPTLFTLGNLLCGFAAVFVASRDGAMPLHWTPLTWAAILVLLGLVLDGLDGTVARLTHSESGLGEQLDSIADMVTFGVAPAFMLMQLIGVGTPWLGMSEQADTLFDRVAVIIAGIYVVCAALRLARFNIEAGRDEHRSFKGLPSPGAAGTVASLVLLHQHFWSGDGEPWTVNAAAVVMLVITLMVAIAMVSQFNYLHLMNRYVQGQAPFSTMLKVVIIGLLLVIDPRWALAVGFVWYSLSAPVMAGYRWAAGRPVIVDEDEDTPDAPTPPHEARATAGRP